MQVEQQGVHKKFCSNCGSQIDPRAEICPKCGVRQSVVCERSRVIAGVFGLLLGGLGIHKFYLGRVGWGIVYLIFCWTLVPSLVGFIEGIIYLTMNDEDFNAKYRSSPL